MANGQEALNNVRKHAEVTAADITLQLGIPKPCSLLRIGEKVEPKAAPACPFTGSVHYERAGAVAGRQAGSYKFIPYGNIGNGSYSTPVRIGLMSGETQHADYNFARR